MKLLFACLMSAYLMYDPAGCIERAKEAMRIWSVCVAPSVFPFLVLIPFFTCDEAQKVYERLFGRMLRRLFAIGLSAAPAVITGLAAGSPACGIGVANAYRAGKIDSREALTALTLASGLSPVFLIVSVGQGMFSNALTGIRIFVCSVISGAVVAFITARLPVPRRKTDRISAQNDPLEGGAVLKGVNAALGICGWMMIFSVYSGLLPEGAGIWLEVSKGCAYAAGLGNERLACAIACFSGFCVFAQNASQLLGAGGEVQIFFLAKSVQCVLGLGLFVLTEAPAGFVFAVLPDAFDASVICALAFSGIIWIQVKKEQRKKKNGIEKK